MNRLPITVFVLMICLSCSQFNKGVIAKKELRSKKPPSVKIAEEFDRKNKTKVYSDPEKAAKMREKQNLKMKKRGDKYLKKKRRKINQDP